MIIPLKDSNLTETLNQFFRDLLEKKIVDALIVPQAVLSGRSYAHTLVKDPSQIKRAAPFLPVLMVNGSKVVSSLTSWDPGQKIGAVLRACEIRALIELAKFKQANLDRVFLIGVDCLGTVESAEFEKMNGEFKIEEYLSGILSGNTANLRRACQVCPYPVPEGVPMSLGFIGVDLKKEVYLRTPDEIAAQLGIEKGGNPVGREQTVSQIAGDKARLRDQFLAELKERFKSIPDLLNEFARCTRCYNCRQECPICYCKECVFLTNIFDHKPDQYLKWAQRKGAIKLPYETLLYHLTRLNHMVLSCVECGGCSSGCPNDLPVYDLFQYVGRDVQAVFDYVPGMRLEEEPPVCTFKEDELEPR
ncbi:MAG: formate dehydrogenase [bacterium]